MITRYKALFRFSGYLVVLVIIFNFIVAFIPLPPGWKALISFFTIVGGIWGVVAIERRVKSGFKQGYSYLLVTMLRDSGWSGRLNPPPFPDHFLISKAQEVLRQGAIASRQTIGTLQFFTYGFYEYASFNRGDQSVPLLIWQAVLPHRLNGWVRIRPSDSFLATLLPDKKLESNEFNAAVEVCASNPKLPYQVFHPDSMAWYLDLSYHPWIHIEGNQCLLVAEKELDKQQFTIIDGALTRCINIVMNSGALETTAKKE